MKKLFLATSACALLLLVGCKDKEKVVEKGEEQSPAQAVIETGEEANEFKFIAPLTGEKVENEVETRAIAVTINNHPLARPQAGIASADFIYEVLVEGDATRYLAVFQSEMPENVGPVRSARDYFIDLTKAYGGFFLAHGYSPEAKKMLDNNVVDNANGMQYDGSYFKRSSARKAPHNSYITGENIQALAEKRKISLDIQKNVAYSFYDDVDSVKMGNVAKNIQMVYTNVNSSYTSKYTYDETSKLYKKAYGNNQVTDEVTGEEVAVSNVLFFEAPHSVIDKEGRRDITLTKGGRAYVFQAGTMREVSWENKDGLLIAVEDDGSEVKLVRGKTWVHIVPTSPGLASAVNYSE